MDWMEMYDVLINQVGASNDALDLAFAIGGCSTDTAESILYYYTGWRSFEGFLEELNGEEGWI